MGKHLDLTGKKFSRLYVLELIREKNKHGRKWKCRCDCGNITYVYGKNLKNGHTTSCGCFHKEKLSSMFSKEKGKAGFTRLKLSYSYGASRRNLDFNLSDEVLDQLFKGNCFYCNSAPSKISKNTSKSTSKEAIRNGEYVYNGIDRIDSSKGYIPKNVVSCCFDCNTAKHQKSILEFKDWLIKCYKNFIEK